MILFHDCSMIQEENNKNFKFLIIFLCLFLKNIGFPIKGKLISTTSVFDAVVAKSTVI